jgi:hypothetical protein
MKVLSAIIAYLKDWKNWLVHALIGILLLLIAFVFPLKVYMRIIIFLTVIILNTLRMRLEKKLKAKKHSGVSQ